MKMNFDIYDQYGELYECIVTSGENEEECRAGCEAYLDRLQGCYALTSEDKDSKDE